MMCSICNAHCMCYCFVTAGLHRHRFTRCIVALCPIHAKGLLSAASVAHLFHSLLTFCYFDRCSVCWRTSALAPEWRDDGHGRIRGISLQFAIILTRTTRISLYNMFVTMAPQITHRVHESISWKQSPVAITFNRGRIYIYYTKKFSAWSGCILVRLKPITKETYACTQAGKRKTIITHNISISTPFMHVVTDAGSLWLFQQYSVILYRVAQIWLRIIFFFASTL